MPHVGYTCVSTADQDFALQLDILKAAGCDLVRAEKVSGSTLAGRAELRTVLDFIGKATPW